MLFEDAQLMPPRAPGTGSQARVPWYRRHLHGGVGDVAARASAVPEAYGLPRRGAIGRRFRAPPGRGGSARWRRSAWSRRVGRCGSRRRGAHRRSPRPCPRASRAPCPRRTTSARRDRAASCQMAHDLLGRDTGLSPTSGVMGVGSRVLRAAWRGATCRRLATH